MVVAFLFHSPANTSSIQSVHTTLNLDGQATLRLPEQLSAVAVRSSCCEHRSVFVSLSVSCSSIWAERFVYSVQLRIKFPCKWRLSSEFGGFSVVFCWSFFSFDFCVRTSCNSVDCLNVACVLLDMVLLAKHGTCCFGYVFIERLFFLLSLESKL